VADACGFLYAIGAFALAGQVCISVQRVFVQKEVFEEFSKLLIEEIKSINIGNPLEKSTKLGPLIRPSEVERVKSIINEAKNSGSRVVGGEVEGNFIKPTIIFEADRNLRVFREEVFGPVVIVNSFNEFSEAIEAVNDSDFGLQAGIFTNDINKAFFAIKNINAGGVLINEIPTFRVDHMPYGGIKNSGIGREGPKFAIEDFTEIKMVIFNE